MAFLYASKLLDSSNFELCFHSLNIQANSTKLAEPSNLSNISSKYYEFADVFNKTKAEVLASHHSYNLQINLEEGTQSWLALYTLFWHLNKKLSRNSLRKTSI